MAEADVLAAIAAVKAVVDEIKADIDKLYDGTGELSIKSLSVVNSGGDAVTFRSSGGNGDGLYIAGNGSGHGVYTYGGATGHGVCAQGGATSGHGVYGYATTAGVGFIAAGAGGNNGAQFTGSNGGAGLAVTGGVTGAGLKALGGATSGPGVYATVGAGNNGDGILAVGAGTGKADINGDVSGGVTGNITGNLSGSVGSVTGAVGSVTAVNDKTGYALTAEYDVTTADIKTAMEAAGGHLALIKTGVDTTLPGLITAIPAAVRDLATSGLAALKTLIDAIAARVGVVFAGDTLITHLTRIDVGGNIVASPAGTALGLATPGATLRAFVSTDTTRANPLRHTTAAANGTWALSLAAGTWIVQEAKDGFYDATEGDSVIEITVVIA
ncbi:MAG: hypothetical protein ACYCXZ_06555 [Coriobacteriia bacterium]